MQAGRRIVPKDRANIWRWALIVAIGLAIGSLIVFTSSSFIETVRQQELTERNAARECGKGQDCPARDLDAQERMADATEALVSLAFIQGWGGILTLIGLGVAAHFARNAWVAAEKQLSATNRPWIRIDTISIGPSHYQEAFFDLEAGLAFPVQVSLSNIGAHPAEDVAIHVTMSAKTEGFQARHRRIVREALAQPRGIECLFNGQTIDREETAKLVLSEIKAAVAEKLESLPQEELSHGPPAVICWLSVVVVYWSSLSAEPYHTGRTTLVIPPFFPRNENGVPELVGQASRQTAT